LIAQNPQSGSVASLRRDTPLQCKACLRRAVRFPIPTVTVRSVGFGVVSHVALSLAVDRRCCLLVTLDGAVHALDRASFSLAKEEMSLGRRQWGGEVNAAEDAWCLAAVWRDDRI
jgi:hypothetical protein